MSYMQCITNIKIGNFVKFPDVKIIGHLSIFLLSFSFPGLTQDCLHRSSYFGYKSTLFCSAQSSGTLVWRYLDSYVIVGVYGAL